MVYQCGSGGALDPVREPSALFSKRAAAVCPHCWLIEGGPSEPLRRTAPL